MPTYQLHHNKYNIRKVFEQPVYPLSVVIVNERLRNNKQVK